MESPVPLTMKPRKPDIYHHLPLKSAGRRELRRRSFDSVVELYDRTRPAYPEQLFDDMVELSGVSPGGQVLEVGPGTGQATLPMARRGFSILGLELSSKMAAFAAAKLKDYPNVEIRNLAYEEWKVTPRCFDIVMAAQAFHWIRPITGFSLSARALKPRGHLALLWNFRDPRPEDFHAALNGIYREYAPRIVEEPRTPEQHIRKQADRITGSGHFAPAVIRRYPWQRKCTADEYIDQLRTQSSHMLLSPGTHRRLCGAIRTLFDSLGGEITQHAVAVLLLARTREKDRP
jgi:SAM-dependent methyltransferase